MQRRKFLEILTGLGISGFANHMIVPRLSAAVNSQTGFVFDEIYLEHRFPGKHPESPERLNYLMQLIRDTGLADELRLLKPLAEVVPHIELIHSSDHVLQIKKNYPASYPVAVAVVGGVLSATDAVFTGGVRNAFCATRPPGHHARNTGREEGFCFFNGIAVAARYAQKYHNINRVLIIDWDYHHGNGTEAAFYDDPDVLFFSTHDYYAYPGTGDPRKTGTGRGKGFNINVHLDCGSGDEAIITAFEEKLLPKAHTFKPELILISAGFDSRKDDLLGCFRVTDTGFVKLTRIVMELAGQYCDGKIVSVLEGGYNIKGNASAAVHHVRTLMGQLA